MKKENGTPCMSVEKTVTIYVCGERKGKFVGDNHDMSELAIECASLRLR